VIGQFGFACGTIVLNAAGAAAAAAVFAASVRLVTGINQLTGTLGTALFPQLAGRIRDDERDLRGVRLGARTLVALSFGATALLMYRPSLVTSFLITHAEPTADAAAIFTLSTSCATGFVVLFTLVLLAQNGEDAFLRVYGTATGIILAGAVAVAFSPVPRASEMAYVFGVGQLAGAVVLARHVAAGTPQMAATVRRTAGSAAVLALLGLVAAAIPDARPVTASAAVLYAIGVAVAPLMRRRRFVLSAETASRV
jgi:O-antigen/teichoic acid export membrane protein